MKIIDSHTHLDFSRPEKLISMADRFGYDKVCMLAIPCYGDPLNTLDCLLAKRRYPGRTYVFGGMTYLPGVEPTAKDHEKQLSLMLDAGCDGWKLLESKASIYRELQLPLDGEVFSRAFAMAEDAKIPITWHVGDPATFWSAETAPKFAVENNWLCVGEGYPSLETLYHQVENVFGKYPKLCASLAHLYFTSDDRPHGERMLEAYENLWLDLTPGTEMYNAFIADAAGWRNFFMKYQDRLVFGTDMEDSDGDVVFGDQGAIVKLVQDALAGSGTVEILGEKGEGLALPETVLEKIMGGNFERRVGQPKKIDEKGLEAYVDWLMPKLSGGLRKRAETMLAE